MVNIDRKEVVTVMDSNGNEIHLGDQVVFDAIGKCFTGFFKGFNRGDMRFASVISGEDVMFNVNPKSITYIQVV